MMTDLFVWKCDRLEAAIDEFPRLSCVTIIVILLNQTALLRATATSVVTIRSPNIVLAIYCSVYLVRDHSQFMSGGGPFLRAAPNLFSKRDRRICRQMFLKRGSPPPI